MEIKKYILVLFLVSLFFSCQSLTGSIDEDEDSGYVIKVTNFSEESYVGFTFYSGVIDINNNFVALDSIVYDNLEIPNKNVGDKVRQDGKKYSIIESFLSWRICEPFSS